MISTSWLLGHGFQGLRRLISLGQVIVDCDCVLLIIALVFLNQVKNVDAVKKLHT